MPSTDEYYTRSEDIEKELSLYDFSGKSVLCPCDSPASAFYEYFTEHRDIESADFVWLDGKHVRYDKDGRSETELDGDGDFRNYETEKLMDDCDITITNPPFSIMAAFLKQLLSLNAKFLVVAPPQAVNVVRVRERIVAGEIRAGNRLSAFNRPDGGTGSASALWLTNLERPPHPFLELKCSVKDREYPSYDQDIGAIHIDRVENIPCDYDGVMSVPLTFIAKHNPEQFEITGFSRDIVQSLSLEGRETQSRMLIRRRSASVHK